MNFATYEMSFPTICIPCIHDWNKNVTPAYIGSIFAHLEIGIVRNVVLVPIKANRGHSQFKAVIYFKEWFNNPAANNIRDKIINRHRAKIVYDDPRTWILLPCKMDEYFAEWSCYDNFQMYGNNQYYNSNMMNTDQQYIEPSMFEANPPVTPESSLQNLMTPPPIPSRHTTNNDFGETVFNKRDITNNLEEGEIDELEAEYQVYGDDSDYIF